MTPRTDCLRFETCSAPICPMCEDSMRDCAWFPDEETCGLAKYRGGAMVTRQRRIARATGKDPERGSFTAAMLRHPCTIMRGIRGLDPETPITEKRSDEWIAGRAGNPKRTLPPAAFRYRKGQRTPPAVTHPAPDVESHHPPSVTTAATEQTRHR